MDQDFIRKGKNAQSGLIIGQQQKKVLRKSQETFNRLIKRIEKLRVEITEINKSLDEKLAYFVQNIYPLQKEERQLNIEIVKLLSGFFKNKKLPRKERTALGGVISKLLEMIFAAEEGEPDDELKQIFKEVQGVSYEDFLEQDFELNKMEIESVFQEYGFDVNLDSFQSNMTREEMMQKVLEMEQEFNKNAESRKQPGRKKSKKQQEREEKKKQAEEARTKNISSIYKQLAKIFHPDLEQDEFLKLEKEELMKQLTNAYENKDLHTLLKLELTWIQKAENITDKLTDEKLDMYNVLLNEQVLQLEREMQETIHHPRYQPLQDFTILPGFYKSLYLHKQKEMLEGFNKAKALSREKLKADERVALAEVKKIILQYNRDTYAVDDY